MDNIVEGNKEQAADAYTRLRELVIASPTLDELGATIQNPDRPPFMLILEDENDMFVAGSLTIHGLMSLMGSMERKVVERLKLEAMLHGPSAGEA
jgi:hypothetical protein